MPPIFKRIRHADKPRIRPLNTVSTAIAAVAFMACLGSATVHATEAKSGELSEKQGDLKELRGKIANLRKELNASEGNRASAAERLKAAERAIATLEKDINELADAQNQIRSQLRKLDAQSRELGHTLDQQQASLERLLSRQYMQGRPDAMRVLLNGDDPNQLSRDLYYLSAIAQSRSDLLDNIRHNLDQKKSLAEDAQERKLALDKAEKQQLVQKQALEGERKKREALLAELSTKVKNQRQEIGQLQRDEKQMSTLVSRLSRLIAQQTAAAKAAEAARKRQAAEAQRKAPVASAKPAPVEKAAPSVGDNAFEPAPNDGSFARQKGKLRLPARGKLSGRFGSPREGGGTWRGLFIQAPSGQPVKAVARGKIVFSEWMRGFGNLVIVDHGDAYLSIYGNNDALNKRVGETVNGGDTIASTGSTGSNPESGLYFEIRHQGQPIDPMSWASLK